MVCPDFIAFTTSDLRFLIASFKLIDFLKDRENSFDLKYLLSNIVISFL